MAKGYNTKQVFAKLRVYSSEHGETLKQLLFKHRWVKCSASPESTKHIFVYSVPTSSPELPVRNIKNSPVFYRYVEPPSS